jgi:GNAT superfamily N-acetyltransferase
MYRSASLATMQNRRIDTTPMISLRPLSADSSSDRADALRVFTEAPLFTEIHEARSPSEADVEDLFQGGPPGIDVADKKSVFGFFVGSDMVGCADVIRGYPSDDCAWIGLLLFSEQHQGRGHGVAALTLIEIEARRWQCGRLQIATYEGNPRGHAFWHREGFKEIRRAPNKRLGGSFIVMERHIAP